MCICDISTYIYLLFFFFNDTATTEIYTLSLHDALPILLTCSIVLQRFLSTRRAVLSQVAPWAMPASQAARSSLIPMVVWLVMAVVPSAAKTRPRLTVRRHTRCVILPRILSPLDWPIAWSYRLPTPSAWLDRSHSLSTHFAQAKSPMKKFYA